MSIDYEYMRDGRDEPSCEPDLYVVESGERYCGPVDVTCVEVTADAIANAREAWELP